MKSLKYIILGAVLLSAAPSFSQTLGQWTTLNSLPSPRSDCMAVVVNTTIYVLGGYAYTTIPYPVLRTNINPDGTLTDWMQESTQMKQARGEGIVVSANGYIYALGGDSGPGIGFSTTAERAQINTDGSLGQWTTISVLPQGFWQATWVQTSIFMYLLGSWEGTTDVWRVTLNPDGSMGTWELMSSHFDLPRYGAQAATVDDYIFLNGGDSGNTVSDQRITERAFIYPDGTLSQWTTLTQTGEYHVTGMMAHIGNRLYVIGGVQGDGAESYHTENAVIKPDYSLDIWYDGAPHPSDRQFFAHVQTSKGLYVIGGWNGNDMSSVEYAPILGVTGIDRKYWENFE